MKKGLTIASIIFLSGFIFSSGYGAVKRVIEVVYAKKGEVVYVSKEGKRWLEKGDVLEPSGEIHAMNGRCVLGLPDGSTIKIEEHSVLKIDEILFDIEKDSITAKFTSLLRRAIFRITRGLKGEESFFINISGARLGVRGTSFLVDVDEDKNTRASAYEGRVEVEGKSEKIFISKGEGAFVNKEGESKKVKLPPPPRIKEFSSALKPPFSIEWDGPEGINAFEVVISKDEDLNDVVFAGVIYGKKVQFFSFPSGIYYLSVQSVDSMGFLSIPENILKFEIKE
jgi:hypothetical protein